MSAELAIPTGMIAENFNDEDFSDLATSSKFLPRLSLTASTSKKVVEGLVFPGRYILENGQTFEDLGTEVRGWICGLRLKAIDINANPIVAYFDPKLPQFQKIKERSDVEKQGPLCGPEFLIYLPVEKKFCTLYMCSKTMRREAPMVKQLLGKIATFKTTMIDNKKNKWWGPVVTRCSVDMGKPDEKMYAKVLESFIHPPESEVEEATAEEKAATGSRER